MSSLALDARSHVDELGLAAGDAEVFSRVATNWQPVVVLRTGED